jgi:hypothetical protein
MALLSEIITLEPIPPSTAHSVHAAFFGQKYKKMHTHRKNVNNRFGVTNAEKYCMRVRRSVRQKRFRMFGRFRGLCSAENVVEHANAHLIDISSYETSDALI